MYSSTSKLNLVVFLGSVRDNRNCTRVLRLAQRHLPENKWAVSVFDPLEMPFEMVKKPLHFYGPDRSSAPKWLQEANEKVLEADAFLLISAEYNCTIPPALSNMLDHFPPPSFAYKPAAFVTYSLGIYGGVRGVGHLRDMVAELGAISINRMFAIPKVTDALDEDGQSKNEHMDKGIVRVVEQLEWFTNAFKNQRAAVSPPS